MEVTTAEFCSRRVGEFSSPFNRVHPSQRALRFLVFEVKRSAISDDATCFSPRRSSVSIFLDTLETVESPHLNVDFDRVSEILARSSICPHSMSPTLFDSRGRRISSRAF